MNHFSYSLTIVQIIIFQEPQNIFSLPKSQTPNYRASLSVFLTIECSLWLSVTAICKTLRIFERVGPSNFQTQGSFIRIDTDRTGLFDMFRFFLLGGGGGGMPPPIIFVVCGPIATKFCTRIDNQIISSNMEKLHKINDVIHNDVIIVRKLAEKTVKRVYFKIAAAFSSFIQS